MERRRRAGALVTTSAPGGRVVGHDVAGQDVSTGRFLRLPSPDTSTPTRSTCCSSVSWMVKLGAAQMAAVPEPDRAL
ncbi:MAG: hypothetical protein R2991_04425 [Thermoanaerobaculia bacterium]